MMQSIDISQSEEIFTVSRLNREVRFVIEGSFPLLWVEGEISNFAAPNSGHWYFSLKDSNAQVRCAMFKPLNRKVDFAPKDGMHVLIKAHVSLYEGRGEFQLIAEHLEEVGEGKLRQAFEALKNRLLAAGLFDPAHKKSLPAIPHCIGIVTSSTGAAIRDILSVLKRRFPSAPVIIYPSLVQGETAAPSIVNALQLANRRKECDVIILARGGGSLEDLWPFNEEIVANAIYQSQIPIISGVGHEVDFTIADFVADLRAPTPTAAAELITPDRGELQQTLLQNNQALFRLMRHKLQYMQQALAWASNNLQHQHPKHRLAEQTQRLDLYEAALVRLQKDRISEYFAQLKTLSTKLKGLTPLHLIRNQESHLRFQLQHLQNAIQTRMTLGKSQLAQASAKLDTLSPLSTLSRGYSIVSKGKQVITKARELQKGDVVAIQLFEGQLDCSVIKARE